jgi:hypothetical protein
MDYFNKVDLPNLGSFIGNANTPTNQPIADKLRGEYGYKDEDAAPSNFLPIDPNNLDPRFFTPEYARTFGGYGALSQINQPNYDASEKDIFGRSVGSALDATISASSTLFNYLTVTPGFTKVSSLNYQMYRDAKIQMYTPVRYCDKSDPLRDGKVVLDSRGLIASMVPVLDKELPNAERFAKYQPIGDDRNKRVDLKHAPDDDDYEITNVDASGVYNPNFLFFVKVSDVTPENMTIAKNAMTARNGLTRQKNEKEKDDANLSKVRQESAEKDMAISYRQNEKQKAISDLLNNGGFMYDITDLLRDDRSVNFLNDSLAQYDIYESPLVGGGAKTFVGTFDRIDVTCEGVINSFKLTLNVFKPIVPAITSLLIGSTKLTVTPDARVVDTTTTKYWVNTLEMNSYTIDNSNSDESRLKNFSVLEQKSVEEVNRMVNEIKNFDLTLNLDKYKQKMQMFDYFVAESINSENPFFKKIKRDDSGFLFTSYFGFDCYGYKIGVNKTTPIYMGKLQSVKEKNVAFKKRYKPKKDGDAINSCDSKYSLSEYDIYIFRMPEDAVTNYCIKNKVSNALINNVMQLAMKSIKVNDVNKFVSLPSYNNYKTLFEQNPNYLEDIYKISNSSLFANKSGLIDENIFYEPFTKVDIKIIDILIDASLVSNSLEKNIRDMYNQSLPQLNTKPQTIQSVGPNEERKDDGSTAAASQNVDDVIRIGDAVTFNKGMGCDGVFYKYAFVANIMTNANGSKSYGLFPITNLDFYKYAAQQIANKKPLNAKCTVSRLVIDNKVPINEVEQYFVALNKQVPIVDKQVPAVDKQVPIVQAAVNDEIKVGDYVEIIDKNFDCGGIKNLKYAKVSEITSVGKNNKNFGKFEDAYNLVIFKDKSDFDDVTKQSSCVVYDTDKLKRVSRDEVETFFKPPTYVPIDGGAKRTRRSHTGPRKRVTRHGNRGLMRRRTYKGRKRGAYSKTAKK